LMVTVVFFQRFYEDVTRQMTSSVVQEIRVVLDRLAGAQDAAAALEIAAPLGIEVDQADTLSEDQREWSDLTGRTIIAVLKENLPEVQAVDLVQRRGFARVAVETNAGPMV
ncbi:MAG: two-component sensor histidine kinase, partial [Pseudomonadota bacterium]